ncbi:flavin-containing monooxygenase [Ornithinimicrobium sufpigmenti]|uniref:flavin-containing monooxygenase n=1 Tax=Ornithinimicrobium sufpigmenti TaxID=2508882 RepID=UPI001036B7D1|nr:MULTISPECIES: NAD(P)/FAD-dependent oxidoreductase [unclassified Ornithinimicrobium]
MTRESTTEYDAIIVGAGFAGMYQLLRLREDLGLRVRVFERGTGVGGTWYWNRYPGARCDVESLFYSYSFDDQLQQEWQWTERFPTQPEILRYANHVADRFDLRPDMSFETSVESAVYDDDRHRWQVTTDDGQRYEAQFLITAVGCLSASRVPDFEGVEDFTGETYHTGRWPHEGVDLSGKKVAVIGTGSSGIQAIPVIAAQAEQVTVFQRTPNFSVPAQNRPLDPEEQAEVKAHFPALRQQARFSPAGVLVSDPIGATADLPEQDRAAELRKRWDEGGATIMSAFTDTAVDETANEVTAEFVRDQIRSIVKDPTTAELLLPRDHPIGTKRICIDTDYYETYNRDNVRLVSIRETPIERITRAGVRVDGTDYDVDVIVFATGFDAMTGPLNQIEIRGRGGQLLREKWAEGPRTYLGVASAGFPNLFMITGPGSPSVLSNMIVSIEQHVDWISDYISAIRRDGLAAVEPEQDAEDTWVEHVNEVASYTLYPKAASWYMGANIPGKPRVFMPYLGGVGAYREHCATVAEQGYPGFTRVGVPVPSDPAPAVPAPA